MNTDLLTKVEQKYIQRVPDIAVGDQVEVHSLVREKNRQRVQVFKGLIISIKGSGLRTMFTVRKISSGIGVEKILPLHSPNIKKIVITKKGNVSRSKLYYLRNRIGKKALKVKTSDDLQLEDFYAVKEEDLVDEPRDEKVAVEGPVDEPQDEKVAEEAPVDKPRDEKPSPTDDEKPAKDSK